jgi:hypothetical protein
MRIRILIFIRCGSGSGFLFDVDPNPDPTFHPGADLDPDLDPSIQIKDQTPEKVLKYALIPHLHFGFSSELMRIWIRFRIQLCTLMRIRILIFIRYGSGFLFDADPDFYLMRMRIRMLMRSTKFIRIRIHNTGSLFCFSGEQ